MTRRSFMMMLLLVAGGMALILSAVGIYAVVAYTVAGRRREIGIRIALGARAADVKRLVVGRSMAWVSAGVALGLGGALAGTRVLQALLFEVSATDARVLAAVSLALVATAALASYLPPRRAARVDPARVLRLD